MPLKELNLIPHVALTRALPGGLGLAALIGFEPILHGFRGRCTAGYATEQWWTPVPFLTPGPTDWAILDLHLSLVPETMSC